MMCQYFILLFLENHCWFSTPRTQRFHEFSLFSPLRSGISSHRLTDVHLCQPNYFFLNNFLEIYNCRVNKYLNPGSMKYINHVQGLWNRKLWWCLPLTKLPKVKCIHTPRRDFSQYQPCWDISPACWKIHWCLKYIDVYIITCLYWQEIVSRWSVSS